MDSKLSKLLNGLPLDEDFQIDDFSKKSQFPISPQLDELINLSIKKGKISKKNREILIKKAKKEGIDPDEFEIILDSKLEKKKKNQEDDDSDSFFGPMWGTIGESLYFYDFKEAMGYFGVILWIILLPFILLWKLIMGIIDIFI